MIIICFIIAWGISLSSCWTIYQNGRAGFMHIKRLHQIRCYNCKYFTDSCYLKCTVNPQIAGSEDAIDCRDYQPQ